MVKKIEREENKSGIELYFHCKKCFQSLPHGVSPKEFQSMEVGLTKDGLFRVWCKRHDCLITDFSSPTTHRLAKQKIKHEQS